MLKLIFACCIYLISLSAFGQSSLSFSYGAKMGYVIYHRLYANSTIKGTHIHNTTSGFMDGWRLAGLTRMEYKRWSAQAELGYAYNIGGSVFIVNNWNNPNNVNTADNWLIGVTPLLKQAEVVISGGYKPLKWLRLSAGLGVWHVRVKHPQGLILYDENTGVESITKSLNEQNRFIYGIESSYQPVVLTRQLGVGIEIRKNFSINIVYDRSITPVSKELSYKDQDYVFRQSADRFVISLGYRFYHPKSHKTKI